MSYNKCECGNDGVYSVELMNRGGRGAVICEACYRKMLGHGGKVIARPNADSKPVLKDVRNSYSVCIANASRSVLTELSRYGCDCSRVAKNTPRVYFPEKSRLNSVVRYAESLRKLSERHGVQWSGFRLTLSSEACGLKREYHFSGDISEWAAFVRQSEHEFCVECGYPQWSALNTGTRKR